MGVCNINLNRFNT